MSLVGELGRERFLRDALEPVLGDYDDVVIDTPPNLGLLTVNALVVAELRCLRRSVPRTRHRSTGSASCAQTIRGLRERLGAPAPEPGRRPDAVAACSGSAAGRSRSALVVRGPRAGGTDPVAVGAVRPRRRRQVPLAVSAPDSSPAIAYASLAEQLMEVSAR